MPGNDKKWDSNAERDLCLAVIMGNQEGERARHNWPRVHTLMTNMGHSFTKDAISQHFTKTIMREFKERHDITAGDAPAPAPAPKKRAAPRKRAASSKSATPSKSKALVSPGDSDSDGSPSKKVKREPSVVKNEDEKYPQERERSVTAQANREQKFEDWMNADI